MLILKRRVGESLMIGDHIEITVLSVEPGGRVNLGVSAPQDLLILRRELQQAASANQDAAEAAPQLVECLEHMLGSGTSTNP